MEERKRSCQYCRFAHRLEEHHAPQLICDRRRGGRKSYRAVHPLGACDGFRAARARAPLPNPWPNERLVPVKGGPHARVDAEDYDKVAGQRWCARHTSGCCYAYIDGRNVSMHRLVMNAPRGLIVDHIDHDGMNNTKRNLRLCTLAENRHNQRPQCGGTSRYKGVSWCRSKRKWQAGIACGVKKRHLGCFDEEIQAARAYDEAALKYFGRFAYLNFPEAAAGDAEDTERGWNIEQRMSNSE